MHPCIHIIYEFSADGLDWSDRVPLLDSRIIMTCGMYTEIIVARVGVRRTTPRPLYPNSSSTKRSITWQLVVQQSRCGPCAMYQHPPWVRWEQSVRVLLFMYILCPRISVLLRTIITTRPIKRCRLLTLSIVVLITVTLGLTKVMWDIIILTLGLILVTLG